MRYTQYNKELERYVVPCLFKPDGTMISFECIAGETYTVENGAGMRYPIGKAPDLVYGEVIDRLAVLENNSEKLAEVLLEREDTMQLLAKEKQEYYDLINRQKVEIERLRKDNEYILMQHRFQRRPGGDCWNDVIEKARAEAIKEFAERLKKEATYFAKAVAIEDIDRIVQEMTEETT